MLSECFAERVHTLYASPRVWLHGSKVASCNVGRCVYQAQAVMKFRPKIVELFAKLNASTCRSRRRSANLPPFTLARMTEYLICTMTSH